MNKIKKYSPFNISFLVIVLVVASNIRTSSVYGRTIFEQDSTNLYLLAKDTLNNQNEGTLIVTDTVLIQEKNIVQVTPDVLKNDAAPDTLFNFNVNTQIHYLLINQFRTTEGKANFQKGRESSKKLELLTKQIDSLRIDYQALNSNSEKERLAGEVVALELETIQLKAETDSYFENARNLEMSYWKNVQEEEFHQLFAENKRIDSIIYERMHPKPIEIPMVNPVAEDSTLTNETTQLTTNTPTTNKVTYKIQIGNYNTKLPASIDRLFKKISSFRVINTSLDEKGSTVYTIGEVSSFNDAVKLQTQIRQEGVKDAFVIAIYNGKRISLNEAKEITK